MQTTVTLIGEPRELAVTLRRLPDVDITVALDPYLLAGAGDDLFARGIQVLEEPHRDRALTVPMSPRDALELHSLSDGERRQVLDAAAHAIARELAYLERQARRHAERIASAL